jgi:hypothetical protein
VLREELEIQELKDNLVIQVLRVTLVFLVHKVLVTHKALKELKVPQV